MCLILAMVWDRRHYKNDSSQASCTRLSREILLANKHTSLCLWHSQILQRHTDTLYPRTRITNTEAQVHINASVLLCRRHCCCEYSRTKHIDTRVQIFVCQQHNVLGASQKIRILHGDIVWLSLLFAIWLEKLWLACPPGSRQYLTTQYCFIRDALIAKDISVINHDSAAWFDYDDFTYQFQAILESFADINNLKWLHTNFHSMWIIAKKTWPLN